MMKCQSERPWKQPGILHFFFSPSSEATRQVYSVTAHGVAAATFVPVSEGQFEAAGDVAQGTQAVSLCWLSSFLKTFSCFLWQSH